MASPPPLRVLPKAVIFDLGPFLARMPECQSSHMMSRQPTDGLDDHKELRHAYIHTHARALADATLWTPELFEIAGRPFKRVERSKTDKKGAPSHTHQRIVDRSGYHIDLFPEARLGEF